MNKLIVLPLLTGMLFSTVNLVNAQSTQDREVAQVEAVPVSSEALLSAAKEQYHQGNYKKVVDLSTEAIRANANNINAFYYRGIARLELGIAKPSLFTEELLGSINADLSRVMELDTLNSEVYFHHGRANYFYVRLKLNSSSLLSVNTNDENYYNYQIVLASINSLKKYLETSHKVKKETYLYLTDAIIYIGSGEAKPYLDSYSNSISVMKDADFYLLKGLAGLKYEQGNESYKNRIENFGNVISIDPNNVYAYFFRAKVYVRLNDIQSAIDDYSQVIKLKPNFKLAYEERAKIFELIGDRKRAANDLNQVERLSTRN